MHCEKSFKVLNRSKTLHVKIIIFLFIILFVLCWQKLSYLNASLLWMGFVHRWAEDEIHSALNSMLWNLTLEDDTIDYTLICLVQLFSVDEFFKMLRFDSINSSRMIPYMKSVNVRYILMFIMKIAHCMRSHQMVLFFSATNRFIEKWTTTTISRHLVIGDNNWHSSVLHSIYVSKWWLNLLMVLVFISQ